MEKMQFNNFLIIRLWEFLLPWQPNQMADHHNFSYFELSLVKQHLYQIRIILHQKILEELSFKKFFFFFFYFFFLNLMLPWQPNKIATGHQTYKLGRETSDDHNSQIWFTSLLWLWRKCNLNHFPIVSLWELSVVMATIPRGRLPYF